MRFVILLLIAGLLGTGLAHAEKKFWVRAFAPDDTREPSIIVKPLDDPDNPYRNQYSAFDQWCIEHYNYYIVPESEPAWQLGLNQAQGFHPYMGTGDKLGVDRSRGLTLVQAQVDENGYLLPRLREPQKFDQEQMPTLGQYAKSSQQPGRRNYNIFYALGYLPNELLAELQRQPTSPAWADHYPSVQQWMVGHNKKTVLLPDGGAIFISEIAANPSGVEGSWLIERYAADSTKLKEIVTTSEHLWQRVLSDIPDGGASPYFRKIPHQRATGEVSYSSNARGINGRYKVFDGESGTTLAVIDYWQNKVFTPETDGPDFMEQLPILSNYFIPFDAQTIARVYLAQQELAKQ